MRHYWSRALLLLCTLLLPTLCAAQVCTHYAAPTGSGNGLSQTTPFRISTFWNVAVPGSTLCLLNGTYTQDSITPPSTVNGTSAAPITIRALNDGGAFIDGQFSRNTLLMNGNSYFIIQGIDFGNAAFEALQLYPNSHHITIQRSCFWNAQVPNPPGTGSNLSTGIMWNSHDNLLEDICVFGYGRNTFIGFEDATKNNVIRRAWFRWDGWPDGNGATCPGPTMQNQYHTFHSNDVYENIITIFSGDLYNRTSHPSGFPCNGLGGGIVHRDGIHDSTLGMHYSGVINYGYTTNNDILGTSDSIGFFSRWVPAFYTDLFMDGRYGRSNNRNLTLLCDRQNPDETYEGGHCELQHINRVTSVINPGQTASILTGGYTNYTECSSLGTCPNFYTGDTPGTGARNCFEYQDGALTSTPLWPWRMDDRIKQALSRSGIGPSLSGTSGPDYAAATVTSEIVARYGAIPSQCQRGAASASTSLVCRAGLPLAQTGWPAQPYQVFMVDSSGRLVSDYTGFVTATTAQAPSGGTLSGTMTVQAAATTVPGLGVVSAATFSNLILTGQGDWRLTFTASSLTTCTTSTFTVQPSVHLGSTSPARGGGVALPGIVTTDFDGCVVGQSGAIDIGALQYRSSVSCTTNTLPAPQNFRFGP